jgi:hypothetical protein
MNWKKFANEVGVSAKLRDAIDKTIKDWNWFQWVITHDGKLIPIEVKSGKEGKLKSLHLFMDESPGKIAIRLYAGELLVTKVVTPNGKMITY